MTQPSRSARLRGFERQLEAAVHEAFELRGSPYFRDALENIIDVWDRRQLTMFELRQQELADLKKLLRDTA